MPTLYFSKEYEHLVQELCTKSVRPDLNEIFPKYRDLMLFSAMVGKKEGVEVERKGIGGEVESNYFKSRDFNKEGVVYLLGLLDMRDPGVLKDGAPECWKSFERYCNGGMQVITGWLSDCDSAEEYASVLLSKIKKMAIESKAVPIKVRKPKIKRTS